MLARQLAQDSKLTPAETCVFLLVIKHPRVTVPRLAILTGCGARTAQFHMSNIYAKLSVGNRRGLDAFLVARGYNTAEDMASQDTNPAGAYILRLETAIRAWATDSDPRELWDIANELA